MKLYAVVEGHGELSAAPVLLRRVLETAGCFDVQVGTPIRRTHSQLRSEPSVQKAVRLALLQPECRAVLFLFDGEDECPMELAHRVRNWAHAASANTPCDVVIAYREYETWFLAALESLRGHRGISADARAPDLPESRRDSKAALEQFMPPDRAYSETRDQPALSASFDMALAFRRNRSFRKLVSAVGSILHDLGRDVGPWPPPSWTEHTP